MIICRFSYSYLIYLKYISREECVQKGLEAAGPVEEVKEVPTEAEGATFKAFKRPQKVRR